MNNVFELTDAMVQALPVTDKTKGFIQITAGDDYVRLQWTWFKHIDSVSRSHSIIVLREDERDINEMIEIQSVRMRKM